MSENPARETSSVAPASNSSSGPYKGLWMNWRLLLVVRFIVIGPQFVVCIMTLIRDWTFTCDFKLYTFLIAYSLFLLIEILVSVSLIIFLPLGGPWTWRNRRRLSISTKIVFMDGITITAHVIALVVGLFFIQQVDSQCLLRSALTYDMTFYVLLIDIIGISCISFPVLTIPCSFIWSYCIPRPRGLTYSSYKNLFFIKFRPDGQDFQVKLNNRASKSYPLASQKSIKVDQDCSICMEPWKKGDTICVLPCHHYYHKKCLRVWFNEHKECPHCRFRISI